MCNLQCIIISNFYLLFFNVIASAENRQFLPPEEPEGVLALRKILYVLCLCISVWPRQSKFDSQRRRRNTSCGHHYSGFLATEDLLVDEAGVTERKYDWLI